jgi:hypothetical protein
MAYRYRRDALDELWCYGIHPDETISPAKVWRAVAVLPAP